MLDFIYLYVINTQYEFALFPVQKTTEFWALSINFAYWQL